MLQKHTFQVVLIGVITTCVAAQRRHSKTLPQIQISFPDVGDFDFQNESLAVITNSNPNFELLCTAPYPIEWIFRYNREDDGTSESIKLVETHRHVQNFSEPSSYKFSSKLRLGYRGKLLSLANFTCQKVVPVNLYQTSFQTHVIMTDLDDKSQLILKVSQENLPSEPKREKTNQNCSRAIATRYGDPEDIVPCWVCSAPNSGKELELDYQGCLSASECNSLYGRQNLGKVCLREGGNSTPNCKAENPNYNPRIVLCKNFGPALAQFYFFGIFRGDDLDDESIPGPPIYFSWDEADPAEMIYIHPINRSVLYVGEEVEIVCEYSRYYFSLGSWFGLWNTVEGMKYVQALDIKPCDFDAEKINRDNCTLEDSWRGTFTARMKTSFFQTGQHRVYCLGLVWNSTVWINASLEFHVNNGILPKILAVEPDTKENFIVGQQHRKLICRYTGLPVPTVTWLGSNNETHFSVRQADETTSIIEFFEVGYQTKGMYTCGVSSYLGEDSKAYHLKTYAQSDTKLSAGTIAGISVLVIAVVVVIILVFARMRQIIQSQQEALRLLTEAEIEEFVKGNPTLLENARKDSFNRAEVIDALPYDEKYEIPHDKLNLDYSMVLGSGQYGTVIKGNISTQTSAHYVNLSYANILPSDKPESILVAVKINKGDLDVQTFKTLLSEIKVMAYLGTHDNIVSLVGACTQNIKNRELYIAVEFCANGSLDVFLKNNKHAIKQKIENGSGSGIGIKELYKWVEEIAGGLEYIHGKKIIHADLAIRNVLLTSEFVAKIGDFGFSRQLVDSTSYTKTTMCALPWRSMAIESLRNLEFSIKSDIWSFGITLWEIFTLGDVPYPGMNYNVDFVNLLEQGLRLYKPPLATSNMYDYMLMCWSNQPDDRPTAGDVKIVCARAKDA